MKILINLKKGEVEVVLKDGDAEIDKINFPEDRNLSEKLLASIDNILKKNRLNSDKIEKVELISDIEENYTSYRIAKAVENAFNWSISQRNN